jgi:hypothetical protein
MEAAEFDPCQQPPVLGAGHAALKGLPWVARITFCPEGAGESEMLCTVRLGVF